jgi:bifunctional N-acetylglucosamine-1-phosphate-uridyltransferase/glucosamine-1-phosphate-acetyltransferase GlmU-like protein
VYSGLQIQFRDSQRVRSVQIGPFSHLRHIGHIAQFGHFGQIGTLGHCGHIGYDKGHTIG